MSAQHLDLDTLNELREVMEDEFDILVEAFIVDARERVEELGSMVAAGDADAARRAAHSLKGSCSNLGVLDLADLAHAAEDTCRSGDLAPVPAMLGPIRQELEVVCGLLARQG